MTAPVANRLAPLRYTVPLLNPSPLGLYGAVEWISDDDNNENDTGNRHLNGVEVRGANYGGENASGVWEPAYYCSEPVPGQIKAGERPDILDPFDPVTVWGYDECDASARSRAEVEDRAAQIVRLREQVDVEKEVGARLLLDATEAVGAPILQPTLRHVVAFLEAAIAQTSTEAYIHVSAFWPAIDPDLFIKSGTRRVSPSGHTWVIGGGYVETLGATMIATSKPFGWRNEITTRPAYEHSSGIYAAIAERTVTIGYEAVIASAAITP